MFCRIYQWPPGHGDFFVGLFLATNLITLKDMRLFQLSIIFFLWVNLNSFILDFGHLCPNYYWLEIFLILLIFIRKQLWVSLIFWIIFFLLHFIDFQSFAVVVVQLLSHVQLSVTPWTAAPQASLSFIISRSLLKLMSIELVMPSNHLILCHPLLLLPSVFPSIRIISFILILDLVFSSFYSFLK